jgi:hypothetical protein
MTRTSTRVQELRTYLSRTPEGNYKLEAADGSVAVEGRSYREVRADLEVLLESMRLPPRRLKILVGSPRRPARSAPPTRPGNAPARSVSSIR